MQVTFMPSGLKQPAQPGDLLIDLAAKAALLLDASCGGKGTCGKCKVQVVSGKTSPMDAQEMALLTAKEIEAGYRLACRIAIEDDLLVIVPSLPDARARKSEMANIPKDFTITHHIKKICLELAAPSLIKQKDEVERMLQAMPEAGYLMSPGLLAQIPRVIEAGNVKITAVLRDRHIIALETGDTTSRCFGIAFDIGTTTVAGMLWDLNKGELLEIAAKTNPQSMFGADVISRISYCRSNPIRLQMMKTRIKDCLNELRKELTENHGINGQEIYEATVVGNTTMSHLFLGVDPAQLARSPFVPVFCLPVDIAAKDLEIDINPLADVHVLPNIAGHIGSDIVGVMLAARIMQQDRLTLAIDVGTNGEILLAQAGRVLACSTAAGPAFEGAAIHQGMRAAAGAIEGVSIEDGRVLLDVIADYEPIGICGSGLIDAVAQLLEAGIVDSTGRMLDQTAANEKEIHPSLVSRLRKGRSGNEFVLVFRANDENLVITQKDVREVQLAKGAIYAGIMIMLSQLGKVPADVESIILAGAFGSCIKKENALRIGLFPNISLDRIMSIGNAAGAGASMALLSMDEREKAAIQSRQVEHVELAGHPDFQAQFIGAMNFPG